MAWVDVLIWIGTALFTVSLIPQLVRTLRLGHAHDLSVGFLVMVLVASAANFVYFMERAEWVAGSGFVANIIVWGVVLFYRLRPRPEPS